MNALPFRYLVGLVLLAACPAYGAVPGSQFTSFAGFDLGRTLTLSQVAERLGPVKLAEMGDAGEYTASICYRSPFGLIYFLSGELGGSEHDLLGFGISASNSAKAKVCASWPSDRAVPDLSLGGVSLGMSPAAFEEAVGASVRWENDVAYVAFDGRRAMTKAEIDRHSMEVRQAILRGDAQNYFDVGIELMATFRDERLVDFRVWKTETE